MFTTRQDALSSDLTKSRRYKIYASEKSLDRSELDISTAECQRPWSNFASYIIIYAASSDCEVLR